MTEQISGVQVQVTGLPDPMVFRPQQFVTIKARSDFHRVRYLRKYRNAKRRSVTDFDLPVRSIPVSELGIGDWLLFPRRENLQPVGLNSDQLYVLGFWLAEGHHLKESKKGLSTFGQHIGICITNTDRTYLDRIKPILHTWFPNSAAHIRAEHLKNPRHRTKYVLEFRSRDTSAFFYPAFGEYAKHKHIPLTLYEHSGLLPLIWGFLDGDGCQFRKGRRSGRVVMSTTSSDLAYQLRQILLDDGIWVTLQYKERQKENHNRIYWLSVPVTYVHRLTGAAKVIDPEVGRSNNHAIPTSEGFYARVKQITRS